jgi:hypothetical protein
MNDALCGVTGLNLGKKLRRADPVDGGWLDKGRIEVIQGVEFKYGIKQLQKSA